MIATAYSSNAIYRTIGLGIGLAYLQITTCKPPDYELNHSRSYLVKVCHWILQCTEYINFLTFAFI